MLFSTKRVNVWKKYAKITFADSLQFPVCNCLLCNKKDRLHTATNQDHQSTLSAV